MSPYREWFEAQDEAYVRELTKWRQEREVDGVSVLDGRGRAMTRAGPPSPPRASSPTTGR